MYDLIVIGGGPAGIISAISSSERGAKVLLLEKNAKLCRKLYITGKGRCNLTNHSDVETILTKIPRNPYFLYSSLYSFDADALMEFFEENGTPLKIERGNRVFPVSDFSGDIIDCLRKKLRELKVDVLYEKNVDEIIEENGKATGVRVKNEEFYAKNVLLATGGKSYHTTGSTGDGYKFAKKFGHKIIDPKPSLVALNVSQHFIDELEGLSLRNVEIKAFVGKKIVHKDFGELVFTRKGISGPVILTTSSILAPEFDVVKVNETKSVGKTEKDIWVEIDLKPAMNAEALDKRLLKDFEKYQNKDFKNSLDELLPQKLIPIIIKLSEINPEKKVNEITKNERKTLSHLLKHLKFNIIGNEGFSQAVITAGGVATDEINPSTMESKIIENLYFAGEIIDVDAFTGGFNLQIAFSTGYLAGSEVRF